ncbi:hypothetical protein KAX06_05335 [candidate division WOR-3 bacterium]|nr:hypothetical protein [candidate division WOR-3 bacterium]
MLDPKTLERYRDCPGVKLCSDCFWAEKNGGYCDGCNSAYQQRCLMRPCDFNCDSCGGGDHATTFACCGRTAKLYPEWREWLKEILETSVGNYAPEPLEIKNRVIPVIYHQEEVMALNLTERFPEIDVWAVPIKKVCNPIGEFHSKDLKDYLNLPKDRKLILSTYAFDNYQEMLWEKGGGMNYREHGIDYWFPGHFSIYMDDSKLYQFLSAKRQQMHAVGTRSQFVWFGLGQNIPVEFLNPIRDAASVLISTSNMDSVESRRILEKEVRQADEWFPKETSFFVVGGTRILPSISNDRALFEFNTNWIMKGIHGRDLSGAESELTKGDLLIQNLKEVLENE